MDYPPADRLLDDCALDQNLGVLRRSLPRTYAWRVDNPRPPKLLSLISRSRSMVSWAKGVFSPKGSEKGTDISGLARRAALMMGIASALMSVFVSILQGNGTTAHAASGFITFATVAIVTMLLALPALRLLAWLGVDMREFAGWSDGGE